MFDIEWADGISMEWIEQNVDLRAALTVEEDPQYHPPSTYSRSPAQWAGEAGMWRMDWQGQCAVLLRVPVLCAEPGEKGWDHVINTTETQQYIAWMRQGIMPPPVGLMRNDASRLTYLNRRRWLAARAAGVESWLAWYWGACRKDRFIGVWWFPERSPHYPADYRHRLSLGWDPSKSMDRYVYGRLVRAGIAA